MDKLKKIYENLNWKELKTSSFSIWSRMTAYNPINNQ